MMFAAFPKRPFISLSGLLISARADAVCSCPCPVLFGVVRLDNRVDRQKPVRHGPRVRLELFRLSDVDSGPRDEL